jgi:hypothetical protein
LPSFTILSTCNRTATANPHLQICTALNGRQGIVYLKYTIRFAIGLSSWMLLSRIWSAMA